MAGTACSICLEELKDPVAIPCGHIHCEKCLIAYIQSGADAMKALCPTCRTSFPLAVPDLQVVPNKYHVYIQNAIRRVYIPQDATYAATIKSLKAETAKAKKLTDALSRDKAKLMDRCESLIAKANNLAQKERDARDENMRLQMELGKLTDSYELMRAKYKSLKSAKSAASSSISAPPAVSRAVKRKSEQAFAQPDAQAGNDAGRAICPVPKRPRLVHTRNNIDLHMIHRSMTPPFYGRVAGTDAPPYYAPPVPMLPPANVVAHAAVARKRSTESRHSASGSRMHSRTPEAERAVRGRAAKPEHAHDIIAIGGARRRIISPVASPRRREPQPAKASGSRPRASGSASSNRDRSSAHDDDDYDDDDDDEYELSSEGVFSDPFEDDGDFEDDEPARRKGKARAQGRNHAYVYRGQRLEV